MVAPIPKETAVVKEVIVTDEPTNCLLFDVEKGTPGKKEGKRKRNRSIMPCLHRCAEHYEVDEKYGAGVESLLISITRPKALVAR